MSNSPFLSLKSCYIILFNFSGMIHTYISICVYVGAYYYVHSEFTPLSLFFTPGDSSEITFIDLRSLIQRLVIQNSGSVINRFEKTVLRLLRFCDVQKSFNLTKVEKVIKCVKRTDRNMISLPPDRLYLLQLTDY